LNQILQNYIFKNFYRQLQNVVYIFETSIAIHGLKRYWYNCYSIFCLWYGMV